MRDAANQTDSGLRYYRRRAPCTNDSGVQMARRALPSDDGLGRMHEHADRAMEMERETEREKAGEGRNVGASGAMED